MNQPDYLISTPENVDLHLELAGLGNRVIAALVDTFYSYVLILLVVLITVVGTTATDYLPLGSNAPVVVYALIGAAIMACLVIHFGYFIFFEGSWRGQTPGKRLMHIRVIDQNGQPISWSASFIRNLIRTVDTGICLVGLVVLLIDRNERRLGDLAAGTLVIRERLSEPMPDTTAFDMDIQSSDAVDAGRISAREYELLLTFLERREKLTKSNRQLMARKLETFFKKKLGETPGDEAPERFLERLYVAYQQRADQALEL